AAAEPPPRWAPASALPGSTARLDRSAPATPAVSGGSLSWTKAASVTVTRSVCEDAAGRAGVAVTGGGAADAPGSGVAGYQYRTSADGGTTWTAPQAGAGVTVSSAGQTLVQIPGTAHAGLAPPCV